MALSYLVDDLLEAARDSVMLAPAEESGQAAKLLAMMNREQRTYLTRLLLSARESYQVATTDLTLVAGTTRYALPSRAVAGGIKQVEEVDASGNLSLWHPFPEERQTERRTSGGAGDYYLEGNTLVLYEDPLAAGTLRITYFRRMNKLVLEESAGKVASFNAGAKTITLTSAPSAWSGSQAYDIIQGTPHFSHRTVDATASISGTTLTFTAALPTDLAAGDYVALAGETPICQAPLELHDVLVARTAYAWLRAKGDPKAGDFKTVLDELRHDALSLISPRVQGSPKVLINFNAPGWNRFRRLKRGYI